MTRWFFAFRDYITDKGLPPVVELIAESFVVRRVMRAVPRADHFSHLGGGLPARLPVDSLRAVGGALDGRPRLGVPRVDFFFPGLRCLVTG